MKKNFKYYVAFYVAKFICLGLKIMHRQASHLPGKMAIKICPDFLGRINKPEKIICITGTDGKTTVTNMILEILEKNEYSIISNKAGANTEGGIASALLKEVSLLQKIKKSTAVFEIDERSAIKIFKYVTPTYLICTNLIRDSIKRNAHPEFIYNIINNSIPKETKLILNADDLISSRLKEKNDRTYYGVAKLDTDSMNTFNIINDIQICPKCNSKLVYEYIKYNHIGKAHCPNCDFKSETADYLVTKVDYENEIIVVNNEEKYKMINNSVFNIYNEVAVITLLKQLNFSYEKIKKAFDELKIVQSRYTKDIVNGIEVISNMTKGQNSVATSCVFDYVRKEPGKKEIILMLDDVFDAKDSIENFTWVYDADFEFLNDENIERIIVGGVRTQDYLVRLELAGIDKSKIFCCENELETYKKLSLEKGKKIYILFEVYATQTAYKLKDNVIRAIKEDTK